MKRWAIYTVFLYALALILLTMPAVLIAFAGWGKNDSNIHLHDGFKIYLSWGYWLWLAVLLAGQALLLLLPIDISERRLPARRKLKIPVIVTAFFLGNLFLAGIFSLLCAIFKDNAFKIFDLQDFFVGIANVMNHDRAQNTQSSDWQSVLSIFVLVLFFWLIWAIIFRRATGSDDPDALLKRATHWLLRGSILELLIAVPSHVIVRRRDDCCAPVGTFWGIATGISVMLLCFGPGVYFLFVEKFQCLKPKETNPAGASKN